MLKVLILLLLTFSLPLYASDKKNIYVILETDSTNKFLNYHMTSLLSKLIVEIGSKKFSDVYIRNASDRSSFNRKNRIDRKKIKKLSQKGVNDTKKFLLNNIPSIKRHMSSKETYPATALGQLSGDLQELQWRSDQTLLIYLGDVIYSKNKTSSRGGYLSLGFINNEKSPFYKEFINKDNSSLDKLKVVVIGRQIVSPKINFGQKKFISMLFYRANENINFLYYSPAYNNFFGAQSGVQADDVNRFGVDIVELALLGKVSRITPNNAFLNDSSKLASIYFEDKEINKILFK